MLCAYIDPPDVYATRIPPACSVVLTDTPNISLYFSSLQLYSIYLFSYLSCVGQAHVFSVEIRELIVSDEN